MNPPRLARAILRLLTPSDDREHLLDDVDEAFSARAGQPIAARIWYWRQTAGAGAVVLKRLARGVPIVPARGGSFWRGIALDVKQAARMLAASRGFTLTAAASLGLAIGASTSLYGSARVALLDSLPLERPEELRLVFWLWPSDLSVSQYNSSGHTDPATGRGYSSNVSYPTFAALRDAAPDHTVGFNFLRHLTADVPGRPASTAGGLILSGNGFSILRVPVMLGRGLTREDDRPGAPPVVVLTHAFWRQALDADPAVLGSVLRLNGAPFQIVGVTSPAFRGLSTGGSFTPPSDVIVPLSAQPLLWVAESGGPSFTATRVFWLRVMLRVPTGLDQRRTQEIDALLTGSLIETGVITADEADQVEVLLAPGARGVDPASTNAARPLRILSAVIGIVLLIACINIAALMLARGIGRQREIAVRQALGAARVRVIRQLLVESLLLAFLGCAVGLLLTVWTRPLIANMLTTGLGLHAAPVPLDWRTLAVAVAVTTVAAITFGLLPAMFTTSGGLVSRLRQHMIGASAPRLRAGRLLLAAQIAVSVPLLVGAGLLLRTLHNLDRAELGFEPGGLVVFRVNLPGTDSDQDRPGALVRRVLDEIGSIPGVSGATVVENALLSGISSSNRAVIDGVTRPMYMNGVGPGFFETLGIRLVAGRAPALTDTAGAPRVAVINQTAEQSYFGGHAIGRRFRLGPREIEVVGVAADSKYASVRGTIVPTVYDSYLQRAPGNMHVVFRASRPVAAMEPLVRSGLAKAAPGAAMSEYRSQAEHIARLSGRERLLARILTLFGLFALILACVGLYAATAYAVARRTSEIGIRVALGARRDQVVWMMLRSSLAVSLGGVAVGLVGAIWSAPVVRAFLYGIEPRDPATLIVAAANMVAVSVAAALLPALRAARMEPLTALRRE